MESPVNATRQDQAVVAKQDGERLVLSLLAREFDICHAPKIIPAFQTGYHAGIRQVEFNLEQVKLIDCASMNAMQHCLRRINPDIPVTIIHRHRLLTVDLYTPYLKLIHPELSVTQLQEVNSN